MPHAEAGVLARPRTHLYLLLDESVSMDDVRDRTIEGVNTFLQTQRVERIDELFVSLLQFSTKVRERYIGRPIATVPVLSRETYAPSGMTALYDSVAAAITHADQHTGVRDRILVVLVTDGEDTASQKVRVGALKALVRSRLSRGNWTFVLLGTEVDVDGLADKIGFDNAEPFNTADIGGAMTRLGQALVRYRQSDEMHQPGTFYSPAQTWQRPQWARTDASPEDLSALLDDSPEFDRH